MYYLQDRINNSLLIQLLTLTCSSQTQKITTSRIINRPYDSQFDLLIKRCLLSNKTGIFQVPIENFIDGGCQFSKDDDKSSEIVKSGLNLIRIIKGLTIEARQERQNLETGCIFQKALSKPEGRDSQYLIHKNIQSNWVYLKQKMSIGQLAYHLNLILIILYEKIIESKSLNFHQDGRLKLQCLLDPPSFPQSNHNQNHHIRVDYSRGENCQSSQHVIDKTTPIDPFYLQGINDILRKKDSLALKWIWDGGLQEKLIEIEKNWNMYKHSIQKQITDFTLLTMYKMYQMNSAFKGIRSKRNNLLQLDLYEQIYPKANKFIHFFSSKLGIPSIENYLEDRKRDDKKERKAHNRSNQSDNQSNIESNSNEKYLKALREQLQIQQTLADKVFYQLLKGEDNEGQNKFLIQYMSCQQFNQNSSHWNDLFALCYHYLHNTKIPGQLFKNIQKERLVQSRCISCCKIFIFDQNIKNQTTNQAPVKVFPTIRRLRQIDAAVKDQICGLLNSGGGVILFDCLQKYRGIFPQGVPMTQKDKEEYQQRIYSYATHFYPKIDVKTHIYVTYVPIISLASLANKDNERKFYEQKKYTGQEGILKENYTFSNRNYLIGQFVTRIRIIPSNPSLLYFWFITPKSIDQPMRTYCQIKNLDGKLTKIETKRMAQHIKKRMKQFNIDQNQPEFVKHLLMSPSAYINHECPEPDLGVAIAQKIKNNNQQKSLKSSQLQERYKYLALLVAKRRYHQAIQQNFRKSRLNCEMITVFQKQNFRTAFDTAAVYHNCKFQTILNQIHNNQKYRFNNRPVSVINITPYLKLERFKQSNIFDFTKEYDYFQQIAHIFTKKYPNETLKAYKFLANGLTFEYYFFTQSKTSNLYLYYLINQNIKNKAVFKNPHLLDKLSQQERQRRMIMIFQKTGKNQQISNFADKLKQSDTFNMFPKDSVMSNVQGICTKQQKLMDQTTIKSQNLSISQTFEHQLPSLQPDLTQKEYFLYSSWQEVLEDYNYLIEADHRSLKWKDL